MKLITRATMLALGTFAAAGLSPAFAQDKDLKVGAIYMDAQGFYAGVRKGIQTGANEAGRKLDVIETNAQGDASKESSFIDSLISSGVQAIIVSPVSADGSSRAIRRAHDAGILIMTGQLVKSFRPERIETHRDTVEPCFIQRLSLIR